MNPREATKPSEHRLGAARRYAPERTNRPASGQGAAAMLRSTSLKKVGNVVSLDGMSSEDWARETSMTVPAARPTQGSMYALVKEGKGYYPIDRLDRVHTAVSYFERHEEKFPLADRRQYATKVAARLESLGMRVPPVLAKYAGAVADRGAIRTGLELRRAQLGSWEPAYRHIVDLEKSAYQMHPDLLWSAMAHFDKLAGLTDLWDRAIPNPIASVYGMYKSADCIDTEVLFEEGNTRVTEHQLKQLSMSSNGMKGLRNLLPDDLIAGFQKDPLVVFRSLPDPHKLILARAAADNSEGRDRPIRVVGSGDEPSGRKKATLD